MRPRMLLVLSFIALLLFLCAFLLRKFPVSGGTVTEHQLQKVTIAQTGDFYLYAPLYIAMDKGYFAKHGLDVAIISTGGDEKTWAAVISGSAQFGVADPTFVAVASQRGQPGKVIATVVNGVPFWGITKRQDIPIIRSPKELDKYTVATFPSPSTAYTLQRAMFTQAGLTPQIREGAFGTLLTLTETGQADIALELEPNVSQAVQNGYRIVYSLADVYGDFTITGLCATPEYLSAHPPVAESLIDAIGESLDFLHEHPDASADLLSMRFPEVKHEVALEALKRVLAAGIVPRTPRVAEDAWRKAIKLRIDAGDLKDDVNSMQFIDNSYSKK